MSKKPTVLMILDGYGLRDTTEGNAAAEANSPVLDGLKRDYPFVKGYASGMAVGLPEGQMGNSEVGHLNIGAGRIVYQELTRITKEIQDGVSLKMRLCWPQLKIVRKMIRRFIYTAFCPTAAFTAITPICMGCWSLPNGKVSKKFMCIASSMDVTPLRLQAKITLPSWRKR